MKELIDKLHHTQELTREEFLTLLSNRNTETESKETGAGQLREPCFRPWAD